MKLKIAVIDNGVNGEVLEIFLPPKKAAVDCRQVLDGGCHKLEADSCCNADCADKVRDCQPVFQKDKEMD